MIICGNCPYLEDCNGSYECPFWEDDDYDEYDEQLTIQKMQQEDLFPPIVKIIHIQYYLSIWGFGYEFKQTKK